MSMELTAADMQGADLWRAIEFKYYYGDYYVEQRKGPSPCPYLQDSNCA